MSSPRSSPKTPGVKTSTVQACKTPRKGKNSTRERPNDKLPKNLQFPRFDISDENVEKLIQLCKDGEFKAWLSTVLNKAYSASQGSRDFSDGEEIGHVGIMLDDDIKLAKAIRTFPKGDESDYEESDDDEELEDEDGEQDEGEKAE